MDIELLDKHRGEPVFKLFAAVFGTLLYAVGTNLFIVPLNFYSSGFMGVGQIIRTLLVTYMGVQIPKGLDIAGFILYLINIPLLILAFRNLGRGYFWKTLLCSTSITTFLTLIPIPEQPLVNEPLTCALIGGIVSGTGTGVTLRNGCCAGGQEILGLVMMKKSRSFSVGKVAIMINIFVYGACALIYRNASLVIYSLICMVITSFMIDQTHLQSQNTAAIIITSDDRILSIIKDEFHRTATYWDGFGAYTEKGCRVIYTAMSRYEAGQLHYRISEVDPHAFVIFTKISNIYGNFKKHL